MYQCLSRDVFAVDASQSQYLQAEDRGNKLKQLLVQTKKYLADSKKRVRHLNTPLKLL